MKGRIMLFVASILTYQFSPAHLTPSAANQVGVASVYSHESGSGTASGQKLNREAFTAAHRTLPFGSKVKVTNKSNGRSVVVTINDRGPFRAWSRYRRNASGGARSRVLRTCAGHPQCRSITLYDDGAPALWAAQEFNGRSDAGRWPWDNIGAHRARCRQSVRRHASGPVTILVRAAPPGTYRSLKPGPTSARS